MKKTGPQKDQALGLSKDFWWRRGGKLHNYTLRRKEAGQEEEIKVIKRREQLKKARLQKNQSEITKVVGDSY